MADKIKEEKGSLCCRVLIYKFKSLVLRNSVHCLLEIFVVYLSIKYKNSRKK
ncbi:MULTISPECIES: hypothetical protein [Psychrilyobacter]|uniref:hypothetical protein n=1 Tax=Psychrilyobacter TaxID=623282 RepID=UPI0013142598|nr:MULTISPECIES: hypothetical protein [Psychrilyobacter]MCS5421399.1 C-GCAxxG-C-C family protein [Psychrilyobacter sp. S5]NDI78486.1 hypothetical protein [Psychrilyobacter piezotolerans]